MGTTGVMTMTIGECLKRARKKAGLSMYAAAKKAGMRPEQILRLEKAKEATVGTVLRLCKVYGVTVSQLTKGMKL